MEEKKRAYVSVYDKRGIAEFCRYLVEYGYELIATDGTAKTLKEAGIPVLLAHDLTGYPEPLGGKVRALHPAVYTGIVANRLTPEQRKEIEGELYPIGLIVINLYPFKKDMEEGLSFEEASSHIDAVGVALLDAAAKNFMQTVTVCDPEDYERVLCDLAAGEIPEDERKYLMYKAFSYTASYDALVAQYLAHELEIPFPKTLTVTFEKAQDMRYGENPHQRAAVYREPLLVEGSLARAKQLAGGTLTYNAVEDANCALELVKEFEDPAVVVCKHGAISAAGRGENLFEAFAKFPLSVLKSAVVAVNGIVDARVASAFLHAGAEVVLAVGFTPEAMGELRYERELILLEMPDIRSKVQYSAFDMTKIYGGLLVQTYDTELFGDAEALTTRKPTEEERAALAFNYKVAKHSRSSAVAIGREDRTLGIGAGQVNRQNALTLALSLAGGETEGAVLASEAGLTAACVPLLGEAKITAVVCTGVPDRETISALDACGIALLSSGLRHFKN